MCSLAIGASIKLTQPVSLGRNARIIPGTPGEVIAVREYTATTPCYTIRVGCFDVDCSSTDIEAIPAEVKPLPVGIEDTFWVGGHVRAKGDKWEHRSAGFNDAFGDKLGKVVEISPCGNFLRIELGEFTIRVHISKVEKVAY